MHLPEFKLVFLSKLPITNIFQLEVVVEVEVETDALADVGSNAVNNIVGMRERLALGTGGQDGTILAEVVQLAALLNGRVIVEGNNDGGIRAVVIGELVGVILDESVAVSGSAHVADHDRLKRNSSPDNFFVQLEQGVELVLTIEITTRISAMSDLIYF